MADQKRWFKVYATILVDPAMQELSAADLGCWVRLGALAASVGEGGRLEFPPAATGLLRVLNVATIADAKVVISRLPNVTFEEGKSRYGGITVTFQKWQKYQEDNTVPERMRALRNKRRRDKKRVEEKRKETLNTLSGTPDDARDILEFLNRKADRQYQPVKANLTLIRARLLEATPDQIRAVIGRKVRAWKGNPEREEYLRPATLFNATKFANYLGELPGTAFEPDSNGAVHG